MKKILLTFTLIYSLNISSQIKFEKGYFIKDDNIKIECLIKNKDWLNIPNEIEYKITDSSGTLKISASDLKAFQIYDTRHYYKKFTFTVDENYKEESENIKSHNTLLRVLVEGSVGLYEYNRNIFLYEKENLMKQLVYKKYESKNRIQEDFAFRKEIFDNLKCDKNKINIRQLKYERKELVNYIKKHLECQNLDYMYFENDKTKSKFNFKVTTGLNFNNIEHKIFFDNWRGRPLYYKSSSINAFFGFETEFLLPFNHNKWSVFLAPNYQQQNNEASERRTDIYGGYNGTIEIKDNYAYIELPVGIRKYFYINDKSRIYVDGSYSFIAYIKKTNDRTFYSDINYSSPLIVSKNAEESIPMALRFGIGYSYNDKYYFSLNYTPIKTLSLSEMNAISILASYKLF